MAVEIGTLIVKGAFGKSDAAPSRPLEVDEAVLSEWRQEILAQVRDMMDEAERRAKER